MVKVKSAVKVTLVFTLALLTFLSCFTPAAKAVSVSAYQYYKSYGSSGTGSGQLSSVKDIAIDGSGNLYVADSGVLNNQAYGRIQELGIGSKFVTWKTIWTKYFSSSFFSLDAITADTNGNVFVAYRYADSAGNPHQAIEKINGKGNVVAKVDAGYSGQYEPPWGKLITAMTCDSAGNLYTGDGDAIFKLNSTLGPVSSVGWGLSYYGDQVLGGLAFDKYGNLFASQYGFNYAHQDEEARIQKFDGTLKYLATPIDVFGGGNVIGGLAVASNGDLFFPWSYVTWNWDTNKQLTVGGINVTYADGTPFTEFSSYGNGTGQIGYVSKMVFDKSGDLFVAESAGANNADDGIIYNNRLTEYTLQPVATPNPIISNPKNGSVYPTAAPTATATSTPKPTATPKSTSTPMPTATLKATSTPKSTSTPKPTSTSSATTTVSPTPSTSASTTPTQTTTSTATSNPSLPQTNNPTGTQTQTAIPTSTALKAVNAGTDVTVPTTIAVAAGTFIAVMVVLAVIMIRRKQTPKRIQ